MKRILPYILSCILLVYLIIVFTFVATKSGEVTCRGVRVAVKNTDVNVFVDEEDVMKAIKKGYGDIMDKSILAVNKDSLERVSKVYISQETKYFYRQRKDSIMNKVFDDNVLDNITYRELFLETAHKRYQRLIPLMSFNCKMGYFFVLGILAKSKDIKNKFELARELQRKMREGIKEVIKSDKVNFNGKIAYTSLAVSFKLYQYLFELNKFIKKLSGKQNILYP